ncbi:TetR/AcrR family transcriptional regulator [Ketobacter sp.]|uniref:TetR/AcrR family transcriptional regulator n=1 Tax=Ketobacter sp. TaxID=2083498 RepID=UPI000F1D4A04|nr:TetR/AcrR family transcriptional regulator [Ketobacter sp.]RLT98712.1 MAG: TetR/AcrR family transcriptional regulator [Ketobacter sp.]
MAKTSQTNNKRNRSAGRPTPEQAAELENHLLAVALAEFLERGYGNASLERIVKNASVSKTTLYSRYPCKEDLFRAVVSQQISRIDPGSYLKSNLQLNSNPKFKSKLHSTSHDLENGLKSYANNMLEFSLKPEMLEVNRLINSEASRFPELGLAAAERTQLGVARIQAFIADCAIEDGIPCQDPKAVAEVFIFMIRGWYTNLMLTNQTVTAAERKRWVDRAVHTLLVARAQW